MCVALRLKTGNNKNKDLCAATMDQDLAQQQYTSFYSDARQTLLTPEFLAAVAETMLAA